MNIVLAHRPQLRAMTPTESDDHEIEPGSFVGTTSGKTNGVWHFDGRQAVRIGIPNPDHRSIATVENGKSLRDAFAAVPMFAGEPFVIHRMELPPGSYYPRIARPSDQHPDDAPGSFPGFAVITQGLVSSLNQLRSLMHMLDTIFEAIHPDASNMSCYGASIRNLLILACTECETHWRSILTANGYRTQRFSTKDFVKLLGPMRLSEYGIKLQQCPWLPELKPFSTWDQANPTTSLNWYDSYNAAKHDRETHFPRATLTSAIESVAAVWVMIAASYGVHGINHFQDVGRYFNLEAAPRWRYSEVYTYPYPHGESPGEETPVNYPF